MKTKKLNSMSPRVKLKFNICMPLTIFNLKKPIFLFFLDGPNVIAVNVTGPGGMNLRGSRYAKPVNVMTKVYRRKRDSSERN